MLITEFPPIIRDMLQHGITPKIGLVEGQVCFILDGFYKSGYILLKPMLFPNDWMTVDRYDKKILVHSFEDLVSLNYDWWMSSRERGCDGWTAPDEYWRSALIHFGYVREIVTKVYEPVSE